jgi:hypothetical protein
MRTKRSFAWFAIAVAGLSVIPLVGVCEARDGPSAAHRDAITRDPPSQEKEADTQAGETIYVAPVGKHDAAPGEQSGDQGNTTPPSQGKEAKGQARDAVKGIARGIYDFQTVPQSQP